MSVPPLPEKSVDPAGAAPPLAPLPVLGHLPSRWEPPSDAERPLTTHAGVPLPAGLLYLGAPPEEIGPVRTAFSSISQDKGAESKIWKRIGGAFGGLVAGCLIVLYLFARVSSLSQDSSILVLLAIGGVVGAIVGWFVARPDHHTSYVGENGVCNLKYGGRNRPISKAETFDFNRGAVLNVTQVNQHYRGIYMYTRYAFTWKDAANRNVHVIKGQHRNKNGQPPNDHPFHFALSAERAWSRFMLPACRERVHRGETVSFPVKGKGAVGVSSSGLTISFGNKMEEVPKDAISAMGVNNGQVTISRVGAKKGFLGIGKEGIYSFPYANLGNARLFLALLAEVVDSDDARTRPASDANDDLPTSAVGTPTVPITATDR